MDCQDRTVRNGLSGQGGQDRKAWTGLSGQDCYDKKTTQDRKERIARKGHPEKDSQQDTAETLQVEQNRQTGQVELDR
jgi:hypothetical protein